MKKQTVSLIDNKKEYKKLREIFTIQEEDNLIDLDNTQTEYFFPKDNDSNDIRLKLPKTNINIWKYLNNKNAVLRYITSGSTGHFFKGIVFDKDTNNLSNKKSNDKDVICEFGLKVTAYAKNEKYGSIYNPNRPENTELLMLKALSYFIIHNETENLILPIQTFYDNINSFLKIDKLITDRKDRYHKFIENYNNGRYENTVSILISQYAKYGDFLNFIKNNYKDFDTTTWKIFFFQIISVLAVIQSKYPSFRHNDFKANNILVDAADNFNPDFMMVYTISGKKFYVPKIKYVLKIWDFDFACINEPDKIVVKNGQKYVKKGIKIRNLKTEEDWTQRLNITYKQNRYYDIHFFFSTLIHPGFFPEIITSPDIDDSIKQFIKRIIPEMYRKPPNVNNKGRLQTNNEFTTPQQILEFDPFFEDFRKSQN